MGILKIAANRQPLYMQTLGAFEVAEFARPPQGPKVCPQRLPYGQGHMGIAKKGVPFIYKTQGYRPHR